MDILVGSTKILDCKSVVFRIAHAIFLLTCGRMEQKQIWLETTQISSCDTARAAALHIPAPNERVFPTKGKAANADHGNGWSVPLSKPQYLPLVEMLGRTPCP